MDESGKVDKIRLRVDNIRIAQREYFAMIRKQRRNERGQNQVAKSMNFSDINRGPGLHQLQPSQMLKKDTLFDEKYQNLQIQSSLDFDNLNYRLNSQNEEDVIDF